MWPQQDGLSRIHPIGQTVLSGRASPPQTLMPPPRDKQLYAMQWCCRAFALTAIKPHNLCHLYECAQLLPSSAVDVHKSLCGATLKGRYLSFDTPPWQNMLDEMLMVRNCGSSKQISFSVSKAYFPQRERERLTKRVVMRNRKAEREREGDMFWEVFQVAISSGLIDNSPWLTRRWLAFELR